MILAYELRGKLFYLFSSISIEYFMIFKWERESRMTNQIVSPLAGGNFLFFMPYISELIAKPLYTINGFRIFIGRLRQIHPFPEGEVAVIHADHPVKMPIFNPVIRTRHPALIISHLLRIHLQPSIDAKLPLILPRHFSH